MKKIKVINKGNLPTIEWEDLKKSFEPNKLKKEKDRNVSDLKESILALGFAIPMMIWEEGKFITDGAGRFIALEMLEYEGYEIPAIPYVPIEAKNKKEAKRVTLAISSQYGDITNDSLGEFSMDMDEIDLSFISLQGFDLEEVEWKAPESKEIDMEKMEEKGKTKMEHTCPKCDFKFTTT